MEGHALSWPEGADTGAGKSKDGRDGARPSTGKTRPEGHGPSWAP